MPEAVTLWSHREDTDLIAPVPVGTAENPLYVSSGSDTWRISTLSLVAADNSDENLIVPANTEYQILSVYISYTSSSTAGNRQLVLQALDADGNVIMAIRAGLVQAATLTRIYQFAPGLVQDAAFRDTDYASVAMMPIMLTAGQKLHIYDKAAIDATHDDMIVRVQVASRSIS